MGKQFCYQEQIGFTLGGDYSATYGYNALSLFTSVSSSVQSASSAVNYSYLSGSDLISELTSDLCSLTSAFNYSYLPNSDLLSELTSDLSDLRGS